YWPEEISPEHFRIYRRPNGRDGNPRKIDEIPVEELENAGLDILERYISYPKEDLLREVAKRFGIGRLTSNVGEYLELALGRLRARGAIVEDNGTIKLV